MDSAVPLDHFGQRARFVALRKKIFEEMAAETARWRITWLLPFQLAVLMVLITQGQTGWRAAVQVAAVAGCGIMSVLQFIRPGLRSTTFSLVFGKLCFFAGVVATGGLASPLIVAGLPMLMGASVTMVEPEWAKKAYFAASFTGFMILALLSQTSVGEIAVPLAQHGTWLSPEFVVTTTISLAFVFGASYRMGCSLSRAYERVAMELASRREELCSETQDRTRELEGIAARLAHEVKNPLAAIKGLSAHMSRNAADPKVAERLSIVAAEADRIKDIVDGFLSFSRGFDDLKVAPTKPLEIAREISLLLETRAADQNVELRVTGNADLSVNADGRKIRQALLNIVLNALQASPPGKTVTIDVGRSCGSDRMGIKVIDEGAGMTGEVLERIRKPYFTTKEGGSGLGVAVARGLIEQHGGKLRFESTPGKGTTVTLELPYCAKKICALSSLPNPLRKATEAAIEATEAATAAATADVPFQAPAR